MYTRLWFGVFVLQSRKFLGIDKVDSLKRDERFSWEVFPLAFLTGNAEGWELTKKVFLLARYQNLRF